MNLDAAALSELAALEASGPLSPERVLKRARERSSALHPHFEWNDAAAADAHRLVQAERLILRARVKIAKAPEATPKAVRLKPLPPSPPPRPAPRPVPTPAPAAARAPASPPPRREAPLPPSPRPVPVAVPVVAPGEAPTGRLAQALRELGPWIMRYGDIPELTGIIAQIHRVHGESKLRQAVAYARQLEDTGLDRRSAAERAAAQFDQQRGKVIELLRAG